MALAITLTMGNGRSLLQVGSTMRMLHGIDVAECFAQALALGNAPTLLEVALAAYTPRPNFRTDPPKPQTLNPACTPKP